MEYCNTRPRLRRAGRMRYPPLPPPPCRCTAICCNLQATGYLQGEENLRASEDDVSGRPYYSGSYSSLELQLPAMLTCVSYARSSSSYSFTIPLPLLQASSHVLDSTNSTSWHASGLFFFRNGRTADVLSYISVTFPRNCLRKREGCKCIVVEWRYFHRFFGIAAVSTVKDGSLIIRDRSHDMLHLCWSAIWP